MDLMDTMDTMDNGLCFLACGLLARCAATGVKRLSPDCIANL